MTDRDIGLVDGLESYPPGVVLAGNLVFWLQVALGAVAAGFVWKWLAAAYLLYFFAGWLFLRYSVCGRCYYRGKRCCMGWGLLLAARDDPELWRSFPDSAGIKVAPFFYGSLSALPVLLLVYELITDFSVAAAIVLASIIVLSGVGFAMRPASCKRCRMRAICPGAAAGPESA